MLPLADLETLRCRIRMLERPMLDSPPGAASRSSHVVPFGIPAIDEHLPEGGLAHGALHEVTGGNPDMHAAGAALFTAGILARMDRPTLWCTTQTDLFAPGLACAGLHPDRVIYAEAPDEKTVLLVMEEALRHPGLSAVVGELAHLPMTASRRLVLAAEKSGVMALALRRRPEGKPEDTGLTAASTRWCVTPVASMALPAPLQRSLGRARWQVDLTRCRGGQPKTWTMEAFDAQGRLSVPAELAHRPAAQIRRAG